MFVLVCLRHSGSRNIAILESRPHEPTEKPTGLTRTFKYNNKTTKHYCVCLTHTEIQSIQTYKYNQTFLIIVTTNPDSCGHELAYQP